jgi:amino acid transporter
MAGRTDRELARNLGLLDAAAIYVGIILGSGIFVAPAAVGAAARQPWTAAVFWLFGGVIAACGAFCYAECGSRLPRTGGFYVFYREAFGEPLAFVGGWAAVLITYPASIAAIATVLARYCRELVPSGPSETSIAIAALLAAGALNAVGMRTGPVAQRVLTAAKVAALALLCAAALVGSRPGGISSPKPEFSWAALLGALVVMLWTYDGWSDVTLVAGEIKDPERNLGRAVLLGSVALVTLYALVQIAASTVLPAATLAGSERVVAEAVEAGVGAGTGRIVAALVVLATFGSVCGTVLTASRISYAMARDGVFPAWFGRADSRWGTPLRSIAGLVLASLVYASTATFGTLLGFFSFSVWIFYGVTALALVRLRLRGVGDPRAWRAPGRWIPPAVVLLTATGMTGGLMAQSPSRCLVGLGILLMGFPCYALWRGLRAPR